VKYRAEVSDSRPRCGETHIDSINPFPITSPASLLISPRRMYQPHSTARNPSRAVLDSFRTAVAKLLSDALPLTPEQAFAGVNYSEKDGEDFRVALPRFRLPGKVADLAARVIECVSPLFRALIPAPSHRIFHPVPTRRID